jgi:hypothetical protein
MPRALPEWVWRLHASLYRHAIAISFGPKPRPGKVEIRSATAFLLDLGSGPMVITAGHVTDEINEAVKNDPGTIVMLGNYPSPDAFSAASARLLALPPPFREPLIPAIRSLVILSARFS